MSSVTTSTTVCPPADQPCSATRRGEDADAARCPAGGWRRAAVRGERAVQVDLGAARRGPRGRRGGSRRARGRPTPDVPRRLADHGAVPQLRDVHVVIHPHFDVVRDITGELQSHLTRADGAARAGRRGGPRVVDARRDRPGPRGRRHRRDRGRTPAGAARRPRGRRGLAEDARPGRCDRRRARATTRRRSAEEIRQGRELLELAGRRPLHLPRLPGVPARARGATTSSCARSPAPGSDPARRPGHVRLLRQAARAGQGQGAREDPARAGQGQLARHRAPAGVPRLRRRQDLRRERRGRRRAPVPRPVLQRRLHRVADPDPAAAREGRRGARPQSASTRAATPARR